MIFSTEADNLLKYSYQFGREIATRLKFDMEHERIEEFRIQFHFWN